MCIFRMQSNHWRRNRSLAVVFTALLASCSALSTFAQGQQQQQELQEQPPPPVAPSIDTSAASASPVAPAHTLTLPGRFRIYGRSVFSPETIVGAALVAGVDQADNEPPGWHQGGDAFGKRFGSAVGRQVISDTIRFGVAAIDGEDPRYFVSQDRGVWARTRHAIVSTFVSQTSSGRSIPAFSRFAGDYGAAFIENAWYPPDRATAGYAAERGSEALGIDVGLNLAREFVPLFRRFKP
jgi:hypothetical protein